MTRAGDLWPEQFSGGRTRVRVSRPRRKGGLLHLTYHPGASSVPGAGILHIRGIGLDSRDLGRRWALLHTRGLAEQELTIAYGPDEAFRASTHVARVIPPAFIKELLTSPFHRLSRSAFVKRLDEYRFRMEVFRDSFAHYERHATRKGWVYQVELFDRTPVHILGVGRYTRVLVLNVHEDSNAAIVFSGRDKAFSRALLLAKGIPVATGESVRSAAEAVRAACTIEYPIVLKGISSGDSEDVLTRISDDRNCAAGARMLLRENRVLVVEKMIVGPEYRLHFINGRLHAVFRCEPLKIVGDGTSSIGHLIRRRFPGYLEAMIASPAGRRRLVNLTWHLGARRSEDLARILPAKGEEIAVSPATGHGVMTECSRRSIQLKDRRMLERLLGDFGAPSAGIDLVLSSPGGKLSDGAVLEVNVPCGFSYLSEPGRAAALELDGVVARCAGFTHRGGRVPVWLVAVDSFSSSARARLIRCFQTRYSDGKVCELHPSGRWTALLSDPEAGAFLVLTSERAVSELGIPANLRPTAFHPGSASDFRKANPELSVTVKNAGGVLRSLTMLDKGTSRT